MPCLLVIDDEPNIAFAIRECLGSDRLSVISASSAREGLKLVRAMSPDVVILDIRLPDMSGLDVYRQIAEIDPRLPVIMVTAYASTETAIEAMRRGAFEYLLKPVDFNQLSTVVNKALQVSRLSRIPAVFGEGTADGAADRIIGNSPAMQEVYKSIGRFSPVDATVLILGESGTGKELVARALYHYSGRSQKPFLAINCAALPESLLESELFGHEQGAFTGADQRRIGKFEQVDGGTIFLDEIGDMTLAMQAKALRLLQEQVFQRIGGVDEVRTDVRVIAATNQDLKAQIEAGHFREDLFYRLNVFTIHLPPLRERKQDIPLLIDHFIRRYNREMHRSVQGLSASALDACLEYDWPGNVRELESAIRSALVNGLGDTILADNLPLKRRAASTPVSTTETSSAPEGFDLTGLVRKLMKEGKTDIYREVMSSVDAVILDEVMQEVDGNQMQACRRLGIARMTLRSKLQAMGWYGESKEQPASRNGAAH
jgi:two-component system nitrogen regulation response regulator GlnG